MRFLEFEQGLGMLDVLDRIQKLQFHDKQTAEMLLIDFVRATFPELVITRAELRPLAVSLNSFNGFLHLANGTRLFFKTHTEPGGILSEYYNAEQLADAGYPILRPLMKSGEAGKQLLIYEYVEAPSVFDVAWAIEEGDETQLAALTQAQQSLDDELMQLYARTLAWQNETEAARAPVHQLFFHRLSGGRLDSFYRHEGLALELEGRVVPFEAIMRASWEINGQVYDMSLNDIIVEAIRLLQPAQAGPSVIGHGDAHNGNVFFHGPRSPASDESGKAAVSDSAKLTYFDPAFAGRHHPLLDLAKPMFHNVYAMWMYHAQQKAAQTTLRANFYTGKVVVNHDYVLHPVRLMFLKSKVKRVLMPTLAQLHARGWLRNDWRAYLKAALFCCPLLTKNLMDSAAYSPKIALLGLSMAVEMGGESDALRSMIDFTLDNCHQHISR